MNHPDMAEIEPEFKKFDAEAFKKRLKKPTKYGAAMKVFKGGKKTPLPIKNAYVKTIPKKLRKEWGERMNHLRSIK